MIVEMGRGGKPGDNASQVARPFKEGPRAVLVLNEGDHELEVNNCGVGDRKLKEESNNQAVNGGLDAIVTAESDPSYILKGQALGVSTFEALTGFLALIPSSDLGSALVFGAPDV